MTATMPETTTELDRYVKKPDVVEPSAWLIYYDGSNEPVFSRSRGRVREAEKKTSAQVIALYPKTRRYWRVEATYPMDPNHGDWTTIDKAVESAAGQKRDASGYGCDGMRDMGFIVYTSEESEHLYKRLIAFNGVADMRVRICKPMIEDIPNASRPK